MTLAIGDKVRITGSTSRAALVNKFTGFEAEVVKNGPAGEALLKPLSPRPDGGYGNFFWTKENLEKIEEPKPEPKFKVGDRAKDSFGGGVVTVIDTQAHEVWPIRARYESGSTGLWAESELTKVGVPFKLEVGDRVVNRATGREGIVFKGAVTGFLKVGDINPPVKDAVPAYLVEDYEDRHPGTYDLIKAAPW